MHKIDAVKILPLKMNCDGRGCFTEIFREEWFDELHPLQWNIVSAHAKTLRGFTVHLKHYDHLITTEGTMMVGLKDLRASSPTFNLSCIYTFSHRNMTALVIPPGVGHSVYFDVKSTYFNAITTYWNPTDDLRCHWSDKELGFKWSVANPVLSTQDKNAPPLRTLLEYLKHNKMLGHQ